MDTNTYEFVITKAKRVESLLKESGGNGVGLNELVLSIKSKLPENIINAIQNIAGIRNKLAHEIDYEISEATLQQFDLSYQEAANFFEGKKSAEELSAEEIWIKNNGFVFYGQDKDSQKNKITDQEATLDIREAEAAIKKIQDRTALDLLNLGIQLLVK
ncbi:hypothetical protein D3C84_831200 [compost metagenome]